MNSTRLAELANWFLNRFSNSETTEFITGDLLEQYQQGRSVWWYCYQALTAILISVWRDLYTHKLLALRAIVVGWVVQYLVSFLWFAFEIHNSTVHRYLQWHFIPWKILPVVLLLNFLTGWIVARLHRRQRTAMVLAYSAFANIYLLWGMWRLLAMQIVNALDQPRFRPYLMFDIALFVVTTVGLILGGIVFGPRAVRMNPDT